MVYGSGDEVRCEFYLITMSPNRERSDRVCRDASVTADMSRDSDRIHQLQYLDDILPAFDSENPDLWLAQLECQLALAGITDDQTRYRHLVVTLPTQELVKVREVIARSPTYTALASALRERHRQRRADRLESQLAILIPPLKPLEYPSALLYELETDMLELGYCSEDRELLREPFLRRLPRTIRAALDLLPSDSSLDDLVRAAGRFKAATSLIPPWEDHVPAARAAVAPAADRTPAEATLDALASDVSCITRGLNEIYLQIRAINEELYGLKSALSSTSSDAISEACSNDMYELQLRVRRELIRERVGVEPTGEQEPTEELNESADELNESADELNESADEPDESDEELNESDNEPNESTDELNEPDEEPNESTVVLNEPTVELNERIDELSESSGVFDELREESCAEQREHSVELREPSVELREPLVELREPSVELREPLVEEREPSVELREPSVELRESLVEERELSVEWETSSERTEPAVELREPSVEREPSSERQPSVDHREPSAELREPSVETRDPSVETKDASVGTRDASVGTRDASLEERESSEEVRDFEGRGPSVAERMRSQLREVWWPDPRYEDGWCYYHWTFGTRARYCTESCTWSWGVSHVIEGQTEVRRGGGCWSP